MSKPVHDFVIRLQASRRGRRLWWNFTINGVENGEELPLNCGSSPEGVLERFKQLMERPILHKKFLPKVHA